MYYSHTVIRFRKEFLALNYLKSNMDIYDLMTWSSEWCSKNQIPNEYFSCFQTLAMAYVEKEWAEEFLTKKIKR